MLHSSALLSPAIPTHSSAVATTSSVSPSPTINRGRHDSGPAPYTRQSIDSAFSSTISGKQLSDLIEDHLVRSMFSSKKRFLPEKAFEKLVTRESIGRELERNGIEDSDGKLVEYISEHASKTFAVMAYQGLIAKSEDLMRHKFDDQRLPIERSETADSGETRVTSGSYLGADDSTLKWFQSWENRDINNFCATQWMFLSVVFTNSHTMEDLHDDCILPLTTYCRSDAGGSFSHLHKADIHEDHQCTSVAVRIRPSLLDPRTNISGNYSSHQGTHQQKCQCRQTSRSRDLSTQDSPPAGTHTPCEVRGWISSRLETILDVCMG